MTSTAKKPRQPTKRVAVPLDFGNIQTIRILTVTDEPMEVQGDEWCKDSDGDLFVYVQGNVVLHVQGCYWLAVQPNPG